MLEVAFRGKPLPMGSLLIHLTSPIGAVSSSNNSVAGAVGAVAAPVVPSGDAVKSLLNEWKDGGASRKYLFLALMAGYSLTLLHVAALCVWMDAISRTG